MRVYANDPAVTPARIMEAAAGEPGVASVHDRASAARHFGLPIDREGDVVVIGDVGTCIGTRESEHDLKGLEGHRLRSHGAVAELRVPLILNGPLNATYAARAKAGMRNFQVFEYAINGVDG